jgi:hypothetical protein
VSELAITPPNPSTPAKDAARVTRAQERALVGGHRYPRAPVHDQKELVAGLACPRQDGIRRDIEDPRDLGDALELSLAAALKDRDFLESLDLVLLPGAGAGRDGFESILGIIGDRSVQHPADQFHEHLLLG